MSTTPVTDLFGDFKSWYESKTIIGILLAAIGSILAAFKPEWGIDLPGTVSDVVDAAEGVAQAADLAYGYIVEVIGIITAIYGRVVASKKIG